MVYPTSKSTSAGTHVVYGDENANQTINVVPSSSQLGAGSEPFAHTPMNNTTPTMDINSDEEVWEDEDWIPCTAAGKQKTPNMIRNQLRKFIDDSPRTQTSIIKELGVGHNSFYKFMNPNTYKNQWSAVQNNTYWAAAKFLEKQAYLTKKAGKNKRKAVTDPAKVQAAKARKEDAETLVSTVAVMAASNGPIYDSCQETIKKVSMSVKFDHCSMIIAACTLYPYRPMLPPYYSNTS